MECLYPYLKVDGMLVSVCSSNDGVWGVSANGELWFRAGLDQVLLFQKRKKFFFYFLKLLYVVLKMLC